MSLISPTPKQRFQESKDNCRKHRELVDSTDFQRGVDFAQMQYIGQLAKESDPANGGACAAAALKLRGLMEFLDVFRHLSEPPTPAPVAPKMPTLDHRA